jgi:vitamin B12/bleomycin/antimicrobial peptide transport system ATP-binding/permease protein
LSDTPAIKTVLQEAARIALPYFRSREKWSALALLAAIIGAQLGSVGIAVATNYWRNAFFQTLQEKDWPGFVTQFRVFCVIGVGFVLVKVYQRYLTQWLSIRWRRWLTTRVLDKWLDGSVHYRAALASGGVDNPDQRIADDIREFIDQVLDLGIGLIEAVASLLSFVAILWSLSTLVPLTLFGTAYTIPGYLVWAALLYAVLGSIATHLIGWRLIPIDYERERREADLRFALVWIREHGESIALLGGEASEKRDLLEKFAALARNWYRLMRLQQFVALFAETYRYYSRYFPYLVMAPLFFTGGMPFGALMQSGSAFNTVRESFSFFIVSYLKIAELSAVVQRLSQFDRTLQGAEMALPSPAGRGDETGAVVLRDFLVTNSAKTPIASLDSLNLRPGEALLLTGVSAAGKTSLLRGIAGIWPYTSGDRQSAALRPLVLPQRAYIPQGTLRRILCYPQDAATIGDGALAEALAAVGLSALDDSLDVTGGWDKRLSEGEKQRLSVARALLFAPDLLLMDEATSALDEVSETALHKLVRARLPAATILAVSHRAALSPFYDRTIEIRPPVRA